ncbi:hypothetical protein ACVVIH_20455 [Chryseobacterium arthrosphaerae]|uniref:hypothetical protein n=1 Tax=Chryseobacterium arthrosphaerae TaxID=651561 RepID=UPI003D35779D
MEYYIGKYKVVPPKPFNSINEALEYIQEKYPELDTVTIEKFLTPKIVDNGSNKSGNLSEENSASDKGDAETGAKVTTGVKSSTDKSRQPNKG